MNQLFGLGEEEKLGDADRMVLLRISRDKMAARRDRRTVRSEPVFVDLLGAQESIPSMAGRYDKPICRIGPRQAT
jgi:hypothetical protein